MAIGRTNAGGGGGAALNFKVVGNPQPTSPSENTIWLNTDVPIASWYFQAEQPENMAEGDVWFPVGTSSTVEFNALKKNGIQVCPLSAKQYVSGALKDVKAKSYIGGKWVEWIVYVFDSNSDASEFTVKKITSNGSVSFESGKIVISFTEANASDVVILKNEKVYIRKGSVISVNAKCSEFEYGNYGYYPTFGITETIPKDVSEHDKIGFVAYVKIKEKSSNNKVYTLNLNSYEGEYYFVVYSAASKCEISEITVQ